MPGDLEGTLGDWRLQMPAYLACCNRVDYNFGRLIKSLKDKGLYDNTVIIYTSDHGCHFRTRNAEYKRSCHEASIKVPLVITGGGFTGGGRVSDLVSLIDLPATVLDIAGVKVPESYAGKSLTDLRGHDSVFMQISESQIGRAVRTKKWKYSVTAKNKDCAYAESYTEDFLYDLESDPYEKNNLVSDPAYADVRADLRELLTEYMKKAGEPYLEIKIKGRISMNHKCETKKKLLRPDGCVDEPGWASSLVYEYSPFDVKANKLRIKEWDYYIIVDDNGYAFCTVIADNRYMGLANSSFYDFNEGKKYDFITPLVMPMGSLHMPTDSSKGDIYFRSANCELAYIHVDGGRRLTGRYKKCLLHDELEFDLFPEGIQGRRHHGHRHPVAAG